MQQDACRKLAREQRLTGALVLCLSLAFLALRVRTGSCFASSCRQRRRGAAFVARPVGRRTKACRPAEPLAQLLAGAKSRDAYLKWVLLHLFGDAGCEQYTGAAFEPSWSDFHGTTILGDTPNVEWQRDLEETIGGDGVQNVLIIGGGDPWRKQGFAKSVVNALERNLFRRRPVRLVSVDIDHAPVGSRQRFKISDQQFFYTAWGDNTELAVGSPAFSWLTHLDGQEETGGYDLILLKNSLCDCESQRRAEAWGGRGSLLGTLAETGRRFAGSTDRTCGGFAYRTKDGLTAFARFLGALEHLLSDHGMVVVVNDNGKPIPDELTDVLGGEDARCGGWTEVSGPDVEGSLGWRGQFDRPLWVYTKSLLA